MDDILSGKINNTYDAEKIFREIMEDENLLRNYKNFSRKKNAQTIVTIIRNLGYAVFGPLLPSKDNTDDIENVDIRDIAGSESEEDAVKRLATIKKISKTSNKEEPSKNAKIGEGLKIMTPNRLLTRLPILLAQKSW